MISDISLAIIVFGWLVNAHLTRKHEIFKLRLGRRTELLESTLEVLTEISLGFNNKVEHSPADRIQLGDRFRRLKKVINIYGYQDEVKAYREMESCLDNEVETGRELESAFGNALRVFFMNLRQEYGFPMNINQRTEILRRRAV